MAFLMSEILGLNRGESCSTVAVTSAWCLSCFRLFITLLPSAR